jgi:hypothetical protein
LPVGVLDFFLAADAVKLAARPVEADALAGEEPPPWLVAASAPPVRANTSANVATRLA